MSRLAFLFPGQGSQHPGMGEALCGAFPESREVFQAADQELGRSLSDVCFRGPEEALALTETTQPAILTVSIAALRALEARGIRAEAAAGHSLGEYSAHVAAGTMDFRDAVRTVRLRGRFMQEAVPVGRGAMAAILGLDRENLEQICRGNAGEQVVVPANLNGPGQVVIAGDREAVERVVALARESGARKAVTLPVSAPFHSPLMQPAADRLARVLAEVPMRRPVIPVYGNADARIVDDVEKAREALTRQVVAPVRWQETIEAMVADGLRTFVEVGPGRVLAGLVRRIDRSVRVFGVADPAGLEDTVRELRGAS